MGARRKGRELALQALYQIDILGRELVPDSFWEQSGTGPRAQEFGRVLVAGVRERREEIDRLIAEVMEHWNVDRLSKVDLNVIRIAVYEFLAGTAPGVEVVINEAIEVVRKFGTGESSSFVNGILDSVARRLGLAGKGGKKEVPERNG